MSFSPLLPVHISVGILGILSSATALPFRNGLPRHAQAGKVFILGPNHVKPRSCGLSPRLLSVLQPKKLVRACISDGGVWIDWTTRYREVALHGWILLEAIPEFSGGDSVWNYCGRHCSSCNHNFREWPAVAQIVAQLVRG